MAMCYKKLWKLLIDRDMTRADLRDKTGLSPATLAKMSKGEAIDIFASEDVERRGHRRECP